MTNRTHAASGQDTIPPDALDRIVIAVEHHAELARRSAVRRDPVSLRRWMLRRARQTRLLDGWGLL